MDEDMDPQDWLAREVFATFGAAVYHGQVLENGIVNLILWSGVSDGTYRTLEDTDAASSELFSKTMGVVKNLLLSRRADIAHLEAELTKAVRLRNFLAHRYFRERAAALMTEEGRNQILDELRQTISFFQETDELLEPLTHDLIRVRGISQQHLAESMDEVRQSGFGASLPGL